MQPRARWAYRTGQALRMWTARVRPEEREAAAQRLPSNLRGLFDAMTVRDQAHGLRVLRRLEAERGGVEPLLLQAALLHDAGKSAAPLGIPGRALVVIAGATRTIPLLVRLPRLGARIRRYTDHPQIGAGLLREAGADGDLVEIVAEHQAVSPRRAETRGLQAVDGRE
jgi:hypothetical protein